MPVRCTLFVDASNSVRVPSLPRAGEGGGPPVVGTNAVRKRYVTEEADEAEQPAEVFAQLDEKD